MINRLFALIVLIAVPGLALGQEPGSVDEAINNAVEPFTSFVTSVVFASFPVAGVQVPFVLVWLIAAATIFTFYFGFINLRAMRHSFQLVRGDYNDPKAVGEVTHFQALATALSGTVGLGNIAGVAIAVSIGGPGATFWMILAGLFGMSSKFVECTLGVKYRDVHPDGSVSGGPMYYLVKGLKERSENLAGLGKVLAVMFAIFCVGGSFGGGNMFQANQSFEMIVNVTGGAESWMSDKGWLYGLILAACVGLVIIGGIKSIARVTGKVVPYMAIIYVVAGLVIIFAHIDKVPGAFAAIVSGAFSPEGIAGGFIGVLLQGFQRAAFSNEAGIGSAAIAHSAVKTNHPVTEGLVALYEPFVDTVVVCTITALVIIVTGSLTPDAADGVALTSQAFGSTVSWFPYLLALAVVLFAFSTMIAWSYYGLKSWTFLFGHHKYTDITYKVLFLAFVVIGASMTLGSVVNFSDAMIFAMAFPNIIGLYFLMPIVKKELNEYWGHYKSGNIARFHKEHDF